MSSSVRSVAVRLSAEVSGYIAGMKSAGNATRDAMSQGTKYASDHKKALSEVGDTAGKVGLAAAAGLGAIVYASANFDQAMSNVQAATHESTQNMDALRQAALDAGAQTAFSATEAADGIEALAKAGVETEDVLGGGLAGALDLAAAGTMGVADAAEAAAGAMAQFKLDGSDVPHIADLLAAGAGKAQGEVSDMVMALKQAGTVSAQTGLSLEETVGALAAMAEQSLLGSDAGTSFKTMLAALTPNSEKAASAMEQYNIHAFDAQGNFVGMTELAGQLRTGLGNLTDEQRAMTLETIFGSDAVRAASIIYDNGAEGIAKWTQNVDDAGYAAETAAIKMDNLKGDWEELMGSLETAAIGAGDGSQGPLRGLVQGATRAVNAFNNLDPAAQGVATGLLGITAITGGGLWFGTKVIQSVANTSQALTDLGVSGGKGAKAMKGLAVAGAGLAALMAGAAAIRAIQAATDESMPGVETLTQQLLNLGNVKLASEFDSVGESLRRLTDRSFTEAWTDTMQTPFEGLFGPAGSVRQAEAEIAALDAAFANIASTGGVPAALDAFRAFAAETDLTVSEQRDLLNLMPGLSEAMAGAANSTTLAGDAAAGATGDVDGLGGAMDGAAREALELDDAMHVLFDGLDLDAATDAWIKGIRGLAKELDGGSGALDRNTKKGQENREEIRGQLDLLRSRAEAEYKQTGNLKLLQRRLLEGRDAIIKQAVAAGIGEKAMTRYLRKLGFTPKEIRSMIKLMGVPEAENGIRDVQVKLSDLDRQIATAHVRARDEASAVIAAIRASMLSLHDKTIYIRSVHTTSRLGNESKLATGGPVVGPGSGTSDEVPILASNGEHMWTAAEVAAVGGHARMMRLRYLAKSGQLRGYATGGGIGPDAGRVTSVAASPLSVSLAGASLAGAATIHAPGLAAAIDARIDARIADYDSYKGRGGVTTRRSHA